MQLRLNIDVPDVQKGVEFYCGAFDFRVGLRLGPSVVELLGGGYAVYLLQKAQG